MSAGHPTQASTPRTATSTPATSFSFATQPTTPHLAGEVDRHGNLKLNRIPKTATMTSSQKPRQQPPVQAAGAPTMYTQQQPPVLQHRPSYEAPRATPVYSPVVSIPVTVSPIVTPPRPLARRAEKPAATYTEHTTNRLNQIDRTLTEVLAAIKPAQPR